MAAKFLNVDLEVEAPESLDHICCELLEAGAFKLYNGETKGGFLATFEIEDGKSGCDPNSIITSFLGAIGSFDDRAKATWNRSHRRIFDIGYEADSEDGSFHSDLKNDVLKKISELGAEIRITLYPRSPED